jgi:hypothetical protein
MKVQRPGSRAAILLLLAGLLACFPSCIHRASLAGSSGPGPGQTAYHSEGSALFLGVDVRAASLAGRSEFLPLYLVVANKSRATLRVDRESFRVETPSGTVLPLVTPQEFRRDYTRSRQDEQMAQGFLDAVAGKFPEPPHHWIDLEFFPPKDSSVVPRTSKVDLRIADVARGYVYVRHPDGSPFPAGKYKLLVKPEGSEETYVVEFEPYGEK